MADRPGTLAEALIALQARLPRITKDATGQVGPREYKYATLANVHDAVFPLLADLGLYWITCPTLIDDRLVLRYSLGHVSSTIGNVSGSAGITGDYPLPENVSSQALGSAITYARRYCLVSVLGIAPADDDDDGARATAEWRPPANPSTRRATRVRGTAAETTDWTTEPAADDTPGTITDEQLGEIAELWISLGTPADERRSVVQLALNVPVKRTRDLSRAQGENLIAYLRALETSTEGGA